MFGPSSLLGWVTGTNLFGAPYDWRMGGNRYDDYFSDLQELIENAYALTCAVKSWRAACACDHGRPWCRSARFISMGPREDAATSGDLLSSSIVGCRSVAH